MTDCTKTIITIIGKEETGSAANADRITSLRGQIAINVVLRNFPTIIMQKKLFSRKVAREVVNIY